MSFLRRFKEINFFKSSLIMLVYIIFLGTFNSSFAAPIITNTATANFSILGSPQQLSDSVQFTKDTIVTPPDDLFISKSVGSSSAYIGDQVSYSLAIQNPNATVLTSLEIQDILPSGLSYVVGSAKLNGIPISAINITLSGNLLNIVLGNIPANTTWNVTYKVNATTLGTKINKVSASSSTATSSLAQATITVTAPPVIPTNPITLTKQANKKRVVLGDVIEYTISIKNPNILPISSIIVNDNLPAGLVYVPNSALLNGTTVAADTTSGLLFNLGTIPANATWTLIYKTKLESITGTGTLTNNATITTSLPSANSSIASETIEISDDKILLQKSTEKENVMIGDSVLYTVIATNPESHALSNVVLSDSLPSGFLYKLDSAKLNGTKIPNSAIHLSENQLFISINSIAIGESVSITYELIVSDKAQFGDAINSVQADSDFAQSVISNASVNVRSPSTIKFLKIQENGIESTIPPTSFNDSKSGGKHWQVIETITLVDGTKVILPDPQPLVDATEYSVLEPIVIEVTDLDQNKNPNVVDTIYITITIDETGDKEVLLLTETAPNSGVFLGVILSSDDATILQNGVLSLSDGSKISVNYKDETDSTDVSATAALVVPNDTLSLTKISDKSTSSIGETVQFTLSFSNTSGSSLEGLIVNDTLPLGFKFIQGSARLNDKPFTNINNDGRHLRFKLNKMAKDDAWTIEYLTKITTGVQTGKVTNIAVVGNLTIKSNIARASILIKDELMRTKNILTGRVYKGCNTDDNPNTLKDVRIFIETGRSTLTDKEGLWHMEGVEAGSHVVQVDTDSLPSGFEPLLCDNNTRSAGSAYSKFVNLQAGSLWQVDFHVSKSSDTTDKKKLQIQKDEKINPSVLFGEQYLQTATERFEVLWPKNNYIPDIASTKIFVKSSPKHKVDVFLNGKKISPLNYDGSSTNKSRTVTVKRWFGVDLNTAKNNNTLLVIANDKNGKEIARQARNIHFSGDPASAEFLPEESILVADGKTTPIIAVRIKDKDGFFMRRNVQGSYNIESSQYQAKVQSSSSEKLNLNTESHGDLSYTIDEKGIARIKLNPTTQSGEVKLTINFLKAKNKTIKAWLKPKLRNWIMVGIAEGTIAHKSLSGNMEALKDLNKGDKFYKSGRLAFFAKGKVRGKYLLTIAYDTHKKKQEVGSQLEGNIDPDAWYTLYGDNSSNQYNAPSSKKLYLKVENENFYALFGDYQTGMNVTELARYDRSLNGIKSEYQSKKFSYNAFISETSNQHHHDEIPGDGTSGLYHLSHNILSNSETIRIETRDRFHSEVILETKQLSRHQDYQIDYDAGTLFFKSPISSRDKNLNPNIIVIDYDSETDNNKEIVAGGRAAYKTSDEKLEVGISALHLGRNSTKNDSLIAIDATYKFTEDTKLHLEHAQSKTEKSSNKSVTAQIVELEKQIAELEARIYYRKYDENFGIDAQDSEGGIRKAGAELRYKINKKTNLKAEISHQENLTDNGKRLLAEVGIEYDHKQVGVNAGIRHTQENFKDKTDDLTNNTVIFGAKYTTENGKVTVRGNLEKNINNRNETEISPDKVVVGVDVKLQKGLILFAEHEITKNSETTTVNSRVGISKDLWKGAKAKTSYTKERTDQGQRNYAVLGLTQRINITDKIQADFSIDQAKTIKDSQHKFNENEPDQHGSVRDDYTAFTVGLGSNEKEWSWTSRFEIRKGDIEDKINFTAGVIRRLEDGKQFSGKLSYYNAEKSNGDSEKTSKLSFGSAWHPRDEDFVFFSRLDLIDEKSNTTDNGVISTDTHTQKIVHNMHFSKKISRKTQVSVHHGIKHVVDTNKDSKHSATIDTATIQVRHDLNEKWDIGVKGGYLRDWTEDTTEAVAGISVGVTPAKNAWIELGYNFEGFDDKDFDDSNYKRKGPYASFRYKFDQNSFDGKDLPVRRSKAKSAKSSIKTNN